MDLADDRAFRTDVLTKSKSPCITFADYQQEVLFMKTFYSGARNTVLVLNLAVAVLCLVILIQFPLAAALSPHSR